ADAPVIDKLRAYFNHPGFIEPMAANAGAAVAAAPAGAQLVFTAHSIPVTMAGAADYQEQLREAAGLVAERLPGDPGPWDLVYQSRSGPPTVPWLGPDVGDHLVA